MSDFSAAAGALGLPEDIVRRSVEARAKADGIGVDEILAAWAGGGAMPAATAAAPSAEASADTSIEAEPPAAPSPAAATAPPAPTVEAPPPPRPSGPIAPPLLVGVNEGTNGIMAGSVAILVLSILLAFLVPSLPQPASGVRTSRQAYSRQALAGQEVYNENGCGSCHTQLIRAVVADARLGPVTLSDSNQVFGSRRIGPDLSAIGGRTENTGTLAGLMRGDGNHPAAAGLSEESMANLLAYLRESK